MNIGGTRISGISPRFWFILGGIIVLIFVLNFFKPEPPTTNVLYDAVFPKKELSAKTYQDGKWIDNYISQYGLQYPTSKANFVDNYESNVGLPLRFKVYIPSQETVKETRPDLLSNQETYSFSPGVFIEPNQDVDINTFSENSATALETQPLVLGFRNSSVPPAGQAYEVTGLLYWRSDELKPPTTDPNAGEVPAVSPVILVSSAQKLSTSELRAPATQRVNLDLVYEESGVKLTLDRIEWSSGREVRACVILENTTGANVPIWQGVSSMTADAGDGSIQGVPDESSSLATASQLEPRQKIPGYITFDETVADPGKALTLRMPTLQTNNGGTGGAGGGAEADSVIVSVPTKDIKSVSATESETTSCGSGTGTGGASDFATGDTTITTPEVDPNAVPSFEEVPGATTPDNGSITNADGSTSPNPSIETN